ncbi:pantoate--beta-alanine ligase [Acidihalobacter prosperus]
MRETARLVELRSLVQGWRQRHERVALVPTMGHLHEGHRALIREARQRADRVVVSIFVNPMQFDDPKDLEHYPRTLATDRDILVRDNVDLLFSPTVESIYPQGPGLSTRVHVTGLDGILEGKYRPGHFEGVATIVCKLFNLVQPDDAVFGEKDYQQLLILRRMVADLDIPVRIHAAPIVREADGLAMSSRNGRLPENDRRRAVAPYKALLRAEDLLKQGKSINAIERAGTDALEHAGLKVDYFAIRRADDLGNAQVNDTAVVILVAAWLGNVRLIDCLPVYLNANR